MLFKRYNRIDSSLLQLAPVTAVPSIIIIIVITIMKKELPFLQMSHLSFLRLAAPSFPSTTKGHLQALPMLLHPISYS